MLRGTDAAPAPGFRAATAPDLGAIVAGTGIELDQARFPQVPHNTVIETANTTNSFSSIDYRFANTIVDIRNNLTRRITARDGAQGTLTANISNTPGAWFVDTGADEYR